MPRSKATLPTDTKLDYTLLDGVPTIIIAASLTTRAQVEALGDKLDQLALVLPEVTKRKPKVKPKNGPVRATHQTPIEEKTV